MKYLILIFTLIIPFKSFCCDCYPHETMSSKQKQEFKYSDNVIIGNIISISDDKTIIKLEVLEVFKGKYIENEIIELNNNLYCAPLINELGKWIIYLSERRSGKLKISNCSISRNLDNPEKNSYYRRTRSIPRFSTPEAYDNWIKAERESLHKKATSDLKKELTTLREGLL